MFHDDGSNNSDSNPISSLNLESFDTKNATNMASMFTNCKVADLNLSKFDTSKVTDMSNMFNGCKTTSLDLSSFDTSKVTDMSNMFNNSSVSKLNLSSFNTKNVTNMSNMFANNMNLDSLDLSSFDTSKVSDMSSMFSICYSLKSLNISNFDTKNVTNMTGMFSAAPQLNNITIGENTKFDDTTNFSPGNSDDTLWINLDNHSDQTPISSSELLSKSNSGNWVIAVPYDATFNTINVPNDVDKDVDTITVPKESLPKYVGIPFKLTITPVTKKGYTTDKSATINVVGNENLETGEFQLTTTDKIHYTKDKEEPTHNNGGGGESSHSTEPDEPVSYFKNSVQYLTVDPTVADATLYNSEGKVVTSEALAHNSDWYSNRIMTRDNVKYYQVATDKYVKASDVYLYQGVSDVVKTHDQEVTYLSTIAGKQVTNRGLARLTDWKADKIVTINGQKYYRVATNEFVNADDVDSLG